jgi:hypothetical protein
MMIRTHKRYRPRPGERGGIAARVLLAVVTLIVVGVFIKVFLDKKEEGQKYHYENALRIAEYGLGQALMQLGQNPSWRAGLPRTSYNEGWYRVSLTTRTNRDTLFLTAESEGSSGPVVRTTSKSFFRTISPRGDTTWQASSPQ